MKRRIYYEVTPSPGGADEGWQITRDGHFLTWHSTQTDAVLQGVQLAVDESGDGTHTGLRIKRRDGSVRDERTYPRSSDPPETKG